MRRVINDQFVTVWDGVLQPDYCQKLIRAHKADPNKRDGYVGHNSIRPDKKRSLDVSWDLITAPSLHTTMLDKLQECLDDYLFLYPDANDIDRFSITEGYNVQWYKPGWGYLARHHERNRSRIYRHLVFMFYLNTVTDDGGTYFPNQDLLLDAVAGRCVIWPADWTHAHHGIISKTQHKFIMTGWYSIEP